MAGLRRSWVRGRGGDRDPDEKSCHNYRELRLEMAINFPKEEG